MIKVYRRNDRKMGPDYVTCIYIIKSTMGSASVHKEDYRGEEFNLLI